MSLIARRPLTSIAVLVVVLGLGFAFSTAAVAAPGDLDPTFSGDGMQTGDFASSANGVAILPSGRIVAVGSGGSAFAIARYNPTGLLDTNFSGDGKVETDFGSTAGARGVALQPNGKIVVAGKTSSGGGDFALARYNPDGSLDKTFSGDGKQTTNFGGSPGYGGDGAEDVAIQADGKIVVVGYAELRLGAFAIARYNANGSPDKTFSGDGKQTTDFGGAAGAMAYGVAILPNGRIVAAGYSGSAFAVARYNPNGSLDQTFSGDGEQTTDFGRFSDVGTDVALQSNAKIVVAGRGGGGGGNFAIARYNPDGSLDKTFSGDGKQTTNFGSYDGANGVAIQADGKIVAAGFALDDGDFGLARYNPNGSPDTTFSGDGKQTTDFGAHDEGANAVAIQGDGKIVAVGRGGGTFALARYLGG